MIEEPQPVKEEAIAPPTEKAKESPAPETNAGDEPTTSEMTSDDSQLDEIGYPSLEGLDPEQIEKLREIKIESHTQILEESGLNEELIKEFKTRCEDLSMEKIGVLALGFSVDLDGIKDIVGDKDIEDLSPEEQKKVAGVMTDRVGKDTLENMALMILGKTMDWAAEGIQGSDLTILLEAIIKGAGANSLNSMNGAYKETEGDNQVSVDKFFKQFAEYPDKSLEKMMNIKDKLATELNWESSTLQDAKNGTKEEKKEALKKYFLEMHQVIAKASSAGPILWRRASILIATEVFGSGAVINPEVLKELDIISRNKDAANKRFDTKST